MESLPKRTIQPSTFSSSSSTTTTPAPTAALSSKYMATTQAQSQASSGLDLFVGSPDAPLADGVYHPSQQGRKRKELEEVEEKTDDIDMEELESIMSVEMDDFNEPSTTPAEKAQLIGNHSVDKSKPASTAAGESSSTSKRPRTNPREHRGVSPVPSSDRSKSSTPTTTIQTLEAGERTSSIRRPFGAVDHAVDEPGPQGCPEEGLADYRSQDVPAVKHEDVSIVVVSQAVAHL